MVAAAVRDFWRRRMYPSSTPLMRHAVESGFLPDGLAGWVSERRAKIGAAVVGAPLPRTRWMPVKRHGSVSSPRCVRSGDGTGAAFAKRFWRAPG